MPDALEGEVRARLSKNESPMTIRNGLLEKGFSEDAINEALKEAAPKHLDDRDATDKRNSRVFAARDLLDRIGYGASAPQFINVFFAFTGAGLFLVGLFNALRAVISMLFTTVLQEYAKVHKVSRSTIGGMGVLFGFSFLLMAFAIRARFVWLFAFAILLAGAGVVTYGDLYNKFVLETLRREKMGGFLRKMGQYGVLLTMVAMLVSGWLIDRFPETGAKVTLSLFGASFAVTPIGYLLAFEITAFAFILSGYLLSFVTEQREERSYPLGKFIKEHYVSLRGHWRGFFHHRYVCLLLIATAIAGILETLAASYYGIYLYREFSNEWLGPVLNVAVVFSIAILASFLGPWFTKKVQRAIGFSPMLVFGTLLTAILPFTFVVNTHLAAIAAAAACSVLGAAMVGYAQGLLARKLMDEETRKRYYLSLGFLLAIPYLVLVPLGAWAAQLLGMRALFLIVGLGLVIVVTPLYFVLVAMANKERL